jgi:folate-binding protein YgfZ
VTTDQPWLDAPRDVVRVSGPDAVGYLQGQVSQDLLAMEVGDRRWTFLLQPTGKVDVLARVERTADDAFVFDTDSGHGEALVARLNRFKIRVDADVEPLPPTGDGTGDEAARVEAGWPAMGREIVPGETIPAETGITPVAVDFRKGCYPGQELVERMDSRGAAAPRRLRILDVPEGARPGDPVVHDGADVGTLTTVAGRRALGYVKRGIDVGTAPPHSAG